MKTVVLSLFIVLTFSGQIRTSAENETTINTVDYSKDVIYQIVTDRFYDGDPSNNPEGDIYSADCSDLRLYCGGDWQGIIDKINDGYLTDLGITAIWISQPVENVYTLHPEGHASYHGYWARDYKRTNPFYGDFHDFDQLVETAHAHGIKVIMDFTPNHSSPALETDSTYMENGAIYDDGQLLATYSDDPNGLFHHYGGTDFSTYEDGIYRNLYDLADYNLQNEAIDRYLKKSIKFWLDKGIDGIRVDAVKHMSQGWQESLMSEIYAHRPVFTFGEWFLGKGEIDPKNHYFANESGMSLLDFQYGQMIRRVLKDGTANWYDFHGMIEDTIESYHHVIDQVTFIDNHDMSRFHSEDAEERQTEMALAVLLTSRGVPTIYYGTEQYLTGEQDPDNRKPMTDFNKDTAAYQIISKLSSLRKNNPALAYGNTQERWINSDVYIYERKFGKHVVLTAVNNGDTNYTIKNLKTALPDGSFEDELDGLLNGGQITVHSDGSADAFILAPKAVSVWSYTEESDTPLIGHVGPMMGKPGNTITINGEGFGSQEGTVYFDDQVATIESWSDREIKATIPDAAGGKYDITVVTSDNQHSDVYDSFKLLTADLVSIRFIVNDAYTEFGTSVYLTGNVSELGNWDPEQAIGPMFNQIVYQYPSWYYDVSVPAGETIEFKFIKKDSSGNIQWESGPNHTYTVPADGTDTVIVDWQQ